MRRAALIASAAALCACSLIVDLGNLSSSSDASMTDATIDAPLGDASTPDASSDALDFCARDAHVFCEDFDEDGGAWNAKLQPVNNGVTLTIGTDDFTSPPASLRTVADAAFQSGYLIAALPQPVLTDFVCTLSVRIEGVAVNGIVQTANISLFSSNPNVNDYSLFFQGDTVNGQLDEYEQMTDGAVTNIPKLLPYSVLDGKWHRIALAVHLGGAATAAMTLDDGLTTTMSITPPTPVTSASFTIGIDYSNASTGWTAHFDDAFCDKL
jgi:hypothetical protein